MTETAPDSGAPTGSAERRLTVDYFSAWVRDSWEQRARGDIRDYAIPALGLVGEAGEVSEHFKKYIRGDGAHPLDDAALLLELGDVLHYWCRLCQLTGTTPAEIMALNIAKCEARYAKGELK